VPYGKHRRRPISAYDVSTVRGSEKVQLLRLGRRPHAFQRAIDEVHRLPLSPPKGGPKSKQHIIMGRRLVTIMWVVFARSGPSLCRQWSNDSSHYHSHHVKTRLLQLDIGRPATDDNHVTTTGAERCSLANAWNVFSLFLKVVSDMSVDCRRCGKWFLMR